MIQGDSRLIMESDVAAFIKMSCKFDVALRGR